MNQEIKEVAIKCPQCKTKFPSPIFLGDVMTFDTAITFGNLAQCPKCGHMVACNAENMSYRLADGSGGAMGPEFGRDPDKRS